MFHFIYLLSTVAKRFMKLYIYICIAREGDSNDIIDEKIILDRYIYIRE